MMADSVRKLIMADVETRLATITTGNGYRTNIGNNVFKWKSKEWQAHEMPGVSFMDTTNTLEDWKMAAGGGRGGIFRNTLRVEFSVAMLVSATGSDNATVMDNLHDAVADIYEAIGTDETWGGNALWTAPASDDMGIDQENRTVAGANIKIDIMFRTKAFKPDQTG